MGEPFLAVQNTGGGPAYVVPRALMAAQAAVVVVNLNVHTSPVTVREPLRAPVCPAFPGQAGLLRLALVIAQATVVGVCLQVYAVGAAPGQVVATFRQALTPGAYFVRVTPVPALATVVTVVVRVNALPVTDCLQQVALNLGALALFTNVAVLADPAALPTVVVVCPGVKAGAVTLYEVRIFTPAPAHVSGDPSVCTVNRVCPQGGGVPAGAH